MSDVEHDPDESHEYALTSPYIWSDSSPDPALGAHIAVTTGVGTFSYTSFRDAGGTLTQAQQLEELGVHVGIAAMYLRAGGTADEVLELARLGVTDDELADAAGAREFRRHTHSDIVQEAIARRQPGPDPQAEAAPRKVIAPTMPSGRSTPGTRQR